jgi:hypothetical protein
MEAAYMRHGKLWIGFALGVICTAVITGSIGSRAKAQESTKSSVGGRFQLNGDVLENPDPKTATEPFVAAGTVVDDRDTKGPYVVNGAMWSITPHHNIEMDFGSLHWSSAYAFQGKKVRVFRITNCFIMSIDDAKQVAQSLQQAIALASQTSAETQPAH